MNGSILGAGWPFAWFLDWYATNADSALESGLVSKNDRGNRLLVHKPDGTSDEIDVEYATPVFGLDGYPLSFQDLRIGDVVSVVRERRGLALVTTEVHLIRRI